MITATGVVRITGEKLEASGFAFDGGGLIRDVAATNEVIDWAIARLESERITVQPGQSTVEKGQ